MIFPCPVLGFQKGVSLFLSRVAKRTTGTTLLATYKRAVQSPQGLVLFLFGDLVGGVSLGLYFEILFIMLARYARSVFGFWFDLIAVLGLVYSFTSEG